MTRREETRELLQEYKDILGSFRRYLDARLDYEFEVRQRRSDGHLPSDNACGKKKVDETWKDLENRMASLESDHK